MCLTMLLSVALLACSSPEPVLGDLPRSAPSAVLLTTANGDFVTVDGTVLGDTIVDIDGGSDDLHPFRTQVLDGGGEVLWEVTTPSPVIVQAFLGYWGGQTGIDILGTLPTLGQFPVQVPLLDAGKTVRFQQRIDGDWQDKGAYDLANVEADDIGVSDEVVGTATLHRSGPSNRRLDIVIVGDGYTSDQLDDFRDDADALSDAILSEEPLKSYASLLNVHRVDIPSAESGASFDCVGECAVRDTAFDTIFAVEAVNRLTGSSYSSRSVFQADQFAVAQAVSHVPWDMVLVISNTDRFGGMAVHFATVTNAGSNWPDVGVHELAHTLGLLGDEYVADACIIDDRLPLPLNIADNPEQTPWDHWIGGNTPIPTPASGNEDTIGAFVAAYNCSTLYRPAVHCKMRDYGGFCDVCSEQLTQRIFRFADLYDDVEMKGRKLRFTGPILDDVDVTLFIDDEEFFTVDATEPIKLGRDVEDATVTFELRLDSPFVRADPHGLMTERVEYTFE